jgi:hypothetical protein
MPRVKDQLIRISKQQQISFFYCCLARGKQASYVDFEQDKHSILWVVECRKQAVGSGRPICDAMPTAHQQFIIHTKTGK